jgi:hypothetical protein
MKPRWDQIWDVKMARIFAASAERDAPTTIPAAVIASNEGHRVVVACLILAGGSLKKLKECAQAALTDGPNSARMLNMQGFPGATINTATINRRRSPDHGQAGLGTYGRRRPSVRAVSAALR